MYVKLYVLWTDTSLHVKRFGVVAGEPNQPGDRSWPLYVYAANLATRLSRYALLFPHHGRQTLRELP